MKPEKKKILFFIFDLGGGGAEKVLVQLANALPADKYDITVQTIFNVGANVDGLKPHIHRKWLFSRQFHGMKYIVRFFTPEFLHRMLIREHYDIEIAYLEGIPTRVVSGCKDPDTKKFAWVHIEMVNKSKFFNTYFTDSGAEDCYRKFDKIAFVSEVARSTFLEKTGWTYLKTAVVHNTLDIQQILASSDEPIAIGLNHDVVNLCSVGRLVTQKGYPRLMRILGGLLKKGIDNWHFYLLGEGELRSEIEAEVEKGGLSGHVTLLGYDPNPYKYVSKMDYFVCSSFKEGYSTAVTESVIVGTPVITTDCSGMREIMGDGVGIIVENTDEALRDALIKVLANPSLCEEFKRGAVARSAAFSTESTLREFEDFINDVND